MTSIDYYINYSQERLGKPIILSNDEHLPIKSLLSTDFDVMLAPQTILASATEKSETGRTLFNVVSWQNITPGFVWLKLNKTYQESRDKFWRDLCIEYTSPDGSNGVYLSSFEVPKVFAKGMKRIKRKETGYFDFCKKIADTGVNFDVKSQGPAVTITVESRQGCSMIWPIGIKCCRQTLFYGDFIFAIKCIGWPREARTWPLHESGSWPPKAVIKEIMRKGYHVVPKLSHPILYKKKKK
ncbi:uncharacterized protein LOC116305695 [Actinia tenebrosa]|uniref:Uncharacterized protein LOC116305695 n=1 Tax=Actinia tenebrosa TaxID=6105 RepID=A0A6P8J009_ACTTE|nr:uncharacterized protein LOC116305695 [Actinia tenebrosa]